MNKKFILSSILEILIDGFPVIFIVLSGYSNLILVVASLGLFLNRLLLELRVFKWLIPLTTFTYVISGIIGIFTITGIYELISGLIVGSRSLQIIDEIGQKLFMEEQPGE